MCFLIVEPQITIFSKYAEMPAIDLLTHGNHHENLISIGLLFCWNKCNDGSCTLI